MYEGELIDIVEPDEVTEQELGLLMAGESRSEQDTQAPAVGDGGEQ
jgi:simple sugar transport system ATP-binding protein